jgi:uncharacterized Zn-binding protein involved in type VI secretion
MAKPAARVTDAITCPIPGHATNSIASGSPDVFFDGLPVAREDDICTCGSTLSSGLSSTVFINGKRAATTGAAGSHGSIVIGGSGTVIIGDTHIPAPFTPPTPLSCESTWISFSVPADYSYEGLACALHFDDGTSRAGVLDSANQVKFTGVSGRFCERVSFGDQSPSNGGSVVDLLIAALE